MDWLVFGDDWGSHPSTTQHLVRHLPADDRVIWFNSIGWRPPRFGVRDLRRLASRMVQPRVRPVGSGNGPGLVVHQAVVAPWHGNRLARAWNTRRLHAAVDSALASAALSRPVFLASNPVAFLYRRVDLGGPTVYLRLDQYGLLPGVDRDLVNEADRVAIGRADLVVATAESLIPRDREQASLLLPQGVDVDHFRLLPIPPGGPPVLGFFGYLDDWIDYSLVRAVAAAMPGWRFEFIGPVGREPPSWFRRIDNVAVLGAVAYRELPLRLARWRASWIPFLVNDLTIAVHPLKLRESLAAGLPTAATPLPALRSVGEVVTVVRDAAEVSRWLASVLASDTAAARANRRQAVSGESWTSRSGALRSAVLDVAGEDAKQKPRLSERRPGSLGPGRSVFTGARR